MCISIIFNKFQIKYLLFLPWFFYFVHSIECLIHSVLVVSNTRLLPRVQGTSESEANLEQCWLFNLSCHLFFVAWAFPETWTSWHWQAEPGTILCGHTLKNLLEPRTPHTLFLLPFQFIDCCAVKHSGNIASKMYNKAKQHIPAWNTFPIKSQIILLYMIYIWCSLIASNFLLERSHYSKTEFSCNI